MATEPLPKPTFDLHCSAPKIFNRTSFETPQSKELDSDIKKGVNYVIGQIVLYWPTGDEEAVRTANLSLVTGHSFYYEQFRPHLERLKNQELRGPSFAPFDIRADGVSHNQPCCVHIGLICIQKHGFGNLWEKVRDCNNAIGIYDGYLFTIQYRWKIARAGFLHSRDKHS